MRRLTIILIAIVLPLVMSAQALPFVAADYSPVTAAKGGASVVETSSTAYAAFTNAAAVPFSRLKGDFAFGYSLWQPSSLKTNVIGLAGSYNINNKVGIAAGFTYGMNPEYEVFDAGGVSDGFFRPSQTQVNLGVSWRFIKYLALGVNLGYAGQKLAEKHGYGAFTSDIFLMTEVKGFKAALGISNLASKVKSASGDKFALPSSLTVGLGYSADFAQKHSIDVNADLDYYFHKAFTAAVGAGYTFNDLLSVRAGYHYGGKSVIPSYASAGLGVKFFGVTIDCAYLIAGKDSPMKNTLSLSAGYRF